MKKLLKSITLAATLGLASNVAYANQCETVRMAEPGWTDLALTTGIASVLLESLGYKTETGILGIPVIYQSMVNNDLDAFLGYWDPAMDTYYAAYRDTGKIDTINQNLEGAKFTFAVPKHVYDAGVKDFSDLQKYADKFDKKLYGMEPGSNEIMFNVVKDEKFGISDWEVVESSEQGMLSQVDRAVRRDKWIAFLAWAPHPMNTEFEIEYLTGGDDHYGPNFGGATVHTQIRSGYETECPNVTKLLTQLDFNVAMESEGMGYILDGEADPNEAGLKIIQKYKDMLPIWLEGVTTKDGKNGLETVKEALSL